MQLQRLFVPVSSSSHAAESIQACRNGAAVSQFTDELKAAFKPCFRGIELSFFDVEITQQNSRKLFRPYIADSASACDCAHIQLFRLAILAEKRVKLCRRDLGMV
jgi:hypothetical protein